MNPKDELIRRAMMHATPHVARPGYSVGGNPGDLATGGFGTGISGRAATARDVAAAVDRGNAMAAAREGGSGGANRDVNQPSATGTSGNQDVQVTPASDTMTEAQFNAMKRDLAQMNAMSTPTGFRGTPGMQTVGGVTPKSFPAAPAAPEIDPARAVMDYNADVRMPDMGSMLGPMPTMGAYDNASIDNALSLSNALSGPNDVMQYGSPVASGRVQDLPGALRSSGTRLHAGVDFAAPTGTPVTPSMPGTVVQVTSGTGYGPVVDVQDIYGNIQRYAVHQTGSVNVQPGQYVAPGDTIGTVGAQNVPKAFEHLHFENIAPGDRAYNEIMGKYNAGTTGGFAGSTRSPRSVGAINSSTNDWLGATGLTTGDQVSSPIGLSNQLAAGTPAMMDRIAGYQPSVTPAAAPAPAPAAPSRMGTPSVYEAAANPIANAYSQQAQADAIAAAQKAGITGYSYNKAVPGEYAVTSTTQSPSQFAALAQSVEQRLAAFTAMTDAQKKAWAANPENAAAIAQLATDIQTLQKMPVDKYGLKKEGTYSIIGNIPSGFSQIGKQAYSVPYGKTYADNVTFSAPQGIPQTVNKTVNTPMARATAPGYGADVAPVLASSGPQSIIPAGLDANRVLGPSPAAIAQANPAPEYYSAPRQVAPLGPSPAAVAQANPAPQYYSAPVQNTIAQQLAALGPSPAAVNQVNPAPEYYSAPVAPNQVAQAPVTGEIPLPVPRPVRPDPIAQALKIASAATQPELVGGRQNDDRRDQKRGKKPVVSEADMQALIAKGYTEKEIKKMSPEEINKILRPDNVAGVAPPVTPTEPTVPTEPVVTPTEPVTAARGGRIGYAEGGRNTNTNTNTNSGKKDTTPVDSYYGPAALPDLPAFIQPAAPPSYTLPQASPLISNFVQSLMPSSTSYSGMMQQPTQMPQQQPVQAPQQPQVQVDPTTGQIVPTNPVTPTPNIPPVTGPGNPTPNPQPRPGRPRNPRFGNWEDYRTWKATNPNGNFWDWLRSRNSGQSMASGGSVNNSIENALRIARG